MEKDNHFYWYWLRSVPGLGNRRTERLIAIFGTAENIYHATQKQLYEATILKDKDIECISRSKTDTNIYKEYCELKKKNIRMITVEDEEYPKRLLHIYDKPLCLFVKGMLPKEDKPSVAVVGARSCSAYGRQTAFIIGETLAQAGVSVISGLARGIDGAAHKGALQEGGYTAGILACGVDICYPREHISIYEQIAQQGGIFSEYLPKTPPLSGYFPMRNRIISGLSDVVVVVEAREKSGSLITADLALEQNKSVIAVPGRVCDELSSGCNNLIKMGAEVYRTPQDILDILRYEVFLEGENDEETGKKRNKKMRNPLAKSEEMLYSNLDFTPKDINILIEETGQSLSEIMGCLVSLSLKGYAKEVSCGCYVRTQKVI